MAQFVTLITAQGQAAFAAAAIPGGKTVDLTYMAVGDGGGNAVTPSSSQTALVRETYRASINSLTVDPNNTNRLICDLVIPASTGGFTIREAGVFDSGGKLIGVANFPGTYKPVMDEGSAGELVVRIILQVTDTSTVKLIIDPTVVLASRQWVLDNLALGKMLPGGTTGQFLRKKSNTYGDCEWSDATEASETVAGILKLATQDMVDAGVDGKAAVTPATLAARLVAASQTQRGLLRLATAAEAATLTAPDAALSPATIASTLSGAPDSGWVKFPNGLISQWGRDRTRRSSETTVTGAFPITWPVGCLAFVPTIYHDPSDTSGQDCSVQGGNPTATTWSVFINYTGSGGNVSCGFDWFAIGR